MTRGTGESRHPAGASSLDADTLEAATDAKNYMRTNAATTPLADLDPFVDLSQSELLAVQRLMTPSGSEPFATSPTNVGRDASS